MVIIMCILHILCKIPSLITIIIIPGARQPLGEGGAKGEGAAGQGDDEEKEEAAHVLKDGDGVGVVFQIAPPLPPARPPLPSPGAGERRLASMAALAEGMLQT